MIFFSKSKVPYVSAALFWTLSISGNAYDIEGEFRKEQPHRIAELKISGDQLCEVAKGTEQYLSRSDGDSVARNNGLKMPAPLSLARVIETLHYICHLVEADQKTNSPSRMNDGAFLLENFEFYRWYPDKKSADTLAGKSTNKIKTQLLKSIPEDKILLTRYYVKKIRAKAKRDATYRHALYAAPYDEQGLSGIDIEKKKGQLTRFLFSRQDILSGALSEGKLAPELVWVDENTLHDALLQGTVIADLNGETRFFNVDKHNGIEYDYAKGSKEQGRYWYFKEVDSVLGYGRKPFEKIKIHPQVTVAGNIRQMGLGKLFLITQQQQDQSKFSRIAILADEGGAFDNNFFQLDLLVGQYWGWDDYYSAHKHLHDYAEVWLMLKKQK